MTKLTASILGASGYVGGELARLLLTHPNFTLSFVTSEASAGKLLTRVHPNLRGVTKLKFCKIAEVQKTDVIFSCLPHGTLVNKIADVEKLDGKLIDCSADFRLKNSEAYDEWYDFTHAAPALLKDFVYGLPEIHGAEIHGASKIAVPGCTATSAILALYPLVAEKLIDLDHIVLDIKTGSSGSGNKPSLGSHHPERAGVVRSYKLAGHRHTAEVLQELKLKNVPGYSVISTPTVRGIVCHAHVFLNKKSDDKMIWQTFRKYYGELPFIRIVKDADGVHALPESKILAGTNFCDLGWVLDEKNNQLVVVTALDNLGKGAAGAAVQCANLACGLPEKSGLEFLGLHPAN